MDRPTASFRSDVPAAWHLSMLMALMHAASGELRAGRVNEADAEPALVDTILGAVGARHGHVTTTTTPAGP